VYGLLAESGLMQLRWLHTAVLPVNWPFDYAHVMWRKALVLQTMFVHTAPLHCACAGFEVLHRKGSLCCATVRIVHRLCGN
jgi:hypothetical protein